MDIKELSEQDKQHHTYKTIKQLADELDLSKTAIRKKFTDEIKLKHLRTVGNIIVIDEIGCDLIKSGFASTVIAEVTEPKTTENQLKTVQKQAESSKEQSIESSQKLLKTLQTTVDILQKQLEIKDKQIETLSATIDNLSAVSLIEFSPMPLDLCLVE